MSDNYKKSYYSEKIEALKKKRAFLGLIRELERRHSFDTTGIGDESVCQEMQEDRQAYEEGIDFLKENILQLVGLFQSKDSDNRQRYQVLLAKADNKTINAHILCKICMMIQSSRFSVFILTPDNLSKKKL